MTRNLLLLLVFLTAVTFTSVNAQCMRDPIAVGLGIPGFYPNPVLGPLPNGTQGSAYVADITVVAPADTTIDLTPFGIPLTQTVGINTLTVQGITNGPAGLTYGSCDPASCAVPGGDNGCFRIEGTPTEGGMFEVGIEVVINIDVPGLGPIDLPSFDFVSYDLEIDGTALDPRQDADFQIQANAPNPFAGMTKIEFSTPTPENFTFEVVDLIGHQVYVEEFRAQAGINTIEFDGSKLAPGMYIYRLNDGNAVLSHRMMIER